MDYPMVAPEYAKMRATLARDAGLGRKVLVPQTAPVDEATAAPSVDSATKEVLVDTAEAVLPPKKRFRSDPGRRQLKPDLPRHRQRKRRVPRLQRDRVRYGRPARKQKGPRSD
ncbi:hypothetical protein RI056_10165 [Komagataeibacter nataicola]|uniref:hypothetical protein n=1 Tax=Komagataeibacter nataicola TaxID=265960 RepID=UPI0028B02C7E|nr:hypothetical protein [Komagataeibacter nataicola]WNM10101.1 hypothetical protein RI056_10165 [Komagataeibacter nataicola]